MSCPCPLLLGGCFCLLRAARGHPAQPSSEIGTVMLAPEDWMGEYWGSPILARCRLLLPGCENTVCRRVGCSFRISGSQSGIACLISGLCSCYTDRLIAWLFQKTQEGQL